MLSGIAQWLCLAFSLASWVDIESQWDRNYTLWIFIISSRAPSNNNGSHLALSVYDIQYFMYAIYLIPQYL